MDRRLAVGGLVLVDDALGRGLVEALRSVEAAAFASSASPASAAARNLRTDVFRADFTALLRSCAASFCRLRLIWDLMFATTGSPRLLEISSGVPGPGPDTKGNDISGRQWRPNR